MLQVMKIKIGTNQQAMPTKERIKKGNSILESIADYVVLDLETTGLDPRQDEIIEVAAIRVRNHVVAEQFTSLVKPQYPIDEFITELTGITNEMLQDAPDITTVLPALRSFIGSDIILGHNVNFDINFIYDKSESLGLEDFSNDYIDTMRMSRRLYPEERHHRLQDLVDRLKVGKAVAHRAMADTEQTKACYDAMLKELQARGVTLADLSRKNAWHNLSENITAQTNDIDPNTAIYGKTFVFTGALDAMTRKEAMQMVVNLGGLCDDTLNKHANYLVLGNQGYSMALRDGKSGKHRKAEKMRLQGIDIQIISEDVFYEMIREASHHDLDTKGAGPNPQKAEVLPSNPFAGIGKLDDIDIYFRGDDYRKAGCFKEALALFDMAKCKGYVSPALYESYAMLYRKIKDYRKEIDILDEGIASLSAHRMPIERLCERKEKTLQLMEKEQADQAAAAEKARLKEEKKQARKAEKALAKENSEPKKQIGRAILQLSDDMAVIRRYESITEAVRESGVNSKSIRDAAAGVQKHAGGYVWRYEDSV